MRRSPSGVTHSAKPPISARLDRDAADRRGCGATAPRSAPRPPPAPASRCNRPACRPAWSAATARSRSSLCILASVTISLERLVQATSGWRRIVPVALQGASTSVDIERRRVEGQGVGDDEFGVQLQPREIGGEPLQPFRGAIDREDARAGAGELRAFCRPARRRDRRARSSCEIGSSRAGSAAAASCTHHSPSA